MTLSALAAQPPAVGTLPDAEPALRLEGIAHRFGGRWVLRGLSMEILPGQAVALLGSNGAGKTTLLRIASTLLRPTRGEARVFGKSVSREANEVRGQLGFLGASPGVYDDLTAAENLAFACKMWGEKPDARRLAGVLERVGLLEHADSRVRGFSTGMRRRVALGRLMLHTPRLLLLDEPYSSFDQDGIRLVNDVVRDTTSAGGAALIATHDLPRARPVVGRIVRIEGGLLKEERVFHASPRSGRHAAEEMELL